MTRDNPVCAIPKFSLRRFENPGRLAICTQLTGVNLKSSGVRYQSQLFTRGSFDLVGNLGLCGLLRHRECEQAQQTDNCDS